jgi:DmsE family decaheme c-type cytochrome
MKRFPSLLLLTAAFVVLGAPAIPAAADKQDNRYAGAGVCQECHDQQTKSLARSLHWKKAIKGSPAADKGCEACHGSAGAHVSAGGGATKDLITFNKQEDPALKSRACLSCHQDSKNVIFWDAGAHSRGNVTCVDCHTIHSSSRHNLKSAEPSLCMSCHKDLRNRMNRRSRHPVQEGKVKCTDCHTPHGGFGRKMVRADSTPDLCFKCHAEKRGPFAFEHAPVVENCATCHDVHGSNHDSLLVSKVPQLCQSCHNTGSGHTSRAYTLQHGFGGAATGSKNKFFARGCLNCHGNIHGSNRSPDFVR